MLGFLLWPDLHASIAINLQEIIAVYRRPIKCKFLRLMSHTSRCRAMLLDTMYCARRHRHAIRSSSIMWNSRISILLIVMPIFRSIVSTIQYLKHKSPLLTPRQAIICATFFAQIARRVHCSSSMNPIKNGEGKHIY